MGLQVLCAPLVSVILRFQADIQDFPLRCVGPEAAEKNKLEERPSKKTKTENFKMTEGKCQLFP